MSWKRGLGIGLIFFGIFIILTARVITGAVVGASQKYVLGWFGILVLVVGMVMILARSDAEGRYEVKDLEKILEEAGEDEDVVFVLDSSGAIDYQDEIEKVIQKYPGRTYVPQEVLKELGNNKDKRLVNKLTHSGQVKQIDPKEDSAAYNKYRIMAARFLGKTKKHRDYLVLSSMIRRESPPWEIDEEGKEEYEKMKEKKVDKWLKKQGKKLTDENRLEYLERYWKVSYGDIDVLTTALMNVAKKRKTKILAHDNHIGQAVTAMVDEYKIGDLLSYIDYREYEKNYKEADEAA